MGPVVVKAATVAQVMSGEVADIAGTQESQSTVSAAVEIQKAVRLGKEGPRPRSHN